MIRKLLIFLLIVITPELVKAQAPGDTCASATSLTLVPVGIYSTGSTNNQLNGNDYDMTDNCNGAPWGLGTDGVYSINVTTAGDYTFALSGGNNWNSLSVYDNCPATNGDCVGGFALALSNTGNVILPLTTGTYYIIIDSRNPPEPFATFTLEITSPIENDEACNATVLPVNAGGCVFSTYSTTGATNSTGVNGLTDPGCAFYQGGDVWFQTTVPAGGSIIIDSDDIDFADSGMAAYSGTCSSLTLLDCDDDGSANGAMSAITLTGRTPGETIFIRFWEYGNNADGQFDICVTEPPPPPPNDEPCGAVALTPDIVCNSTSGYVDQATNSGIDSCAGTPDNDVWYSFVATNTTHGIRIQNASGNSTDMYHAVYGPFTPPDCSVAVADNISCSDNDTSSVSGLTIGATYYVQVFTYWTGPHTTTFDICITEPCALPTAITTDECPYITVSPSSSTITSCGPGSGSETLTADFLDLGDTSDYDADLINYDTTVFNNFDSAAIFSVALSNDDRWSDIAYTLPIDFCYYGNTVSQFVVGANSMVTFNTSYANTPCGYSFNDDLPSTNGDLFDNTIYASYHDIDPGVGGSIRYGSTSVNGCQAFVIIWDDVPMFYDNSLFSTTMLVLYENTNIIEVYIKEKVIDGGAPWNNGNAIVGVQNIGATEAVVAQCRNGLDDNWTAVNEAWRFTPSGGSSIVDLQWLVNGVLDPSYDGQTSINVSPSSTTTYTAQATYNLCNATTLVETDDTTITVTGGKVWVGGDTTVPNTDPVDWMNADNWSDGVIPTSADCVIIPATANDPILYDNNHGDGLYMIIETGATLTLTSDTNSDNMASSVTIQDYIDIQGTGSLIIQDDASLIQVYDSSTPTTPSAANSGNIELYRNTDIRRTDYVYWSSPVQNFNVSNVYGAFTPLGYIFDWIPTIPTGTNAPGTLPTGGMPICYGNWNPNSSATMALGKGYIVRGPTNHSNTISSATSVFTGVPNNGVITQPISSGTNSFANSNYTYNPYGVDVLTVTPFDDNWNLLGNPYPSALDAQSFLTHANNSIIEGAVHIWTHGIQIGNNGDSFYDDYAVTYSVNDYVTYNFSGTNTFQDETFGGKIASGQGFFVLALNDSESGSVTFNNSMRDRTHSNTAFYRTDVSNNDVSDDNSIERNRIWLNLVDQNEATSSILIGYIEGATQEKDRLYDAFAREVNNLSLYSKIDDQRMIIQGRALPFDDNDQIPLGTVIPQAGQYTIAISNVDGLFLNDEQSIYLEDTYIGVIHDLRATPYTFNVTESIDYGDRFILRYTNDTLSDNESQLALGLTIKAPKGDYIKVNSNLNVIESVIVYDLLGRVLFEKNEINQTEIIINNHDLSTGAYIVRAILNNGKSKIQKIVLK